MAKYITIVSGKGGVGKTTISLELASSLAKLGKRVILIDSDLYSPSVSIHLGRQTFPTTFNDALEGKINIKEALYDHPNGTTIVPLDINYHRIKEYEKLHLKMPEHKSIFSLSNVSKHLLELNDEADYVIIDTKNPFHPLTKNLIKFSRNSILITTPDVASVSSNLLAKKVIEEQNARAIGVISNKHLFDLDELSEKNIENQLSSKVLVKIPHDNRIKDTIAMKNTVSYLFDGEDIANVFLNLANNIIKMDKK